MCYYTLSAEVSNKDGHTKALMVIDAVNHEAALKEWTLTFNIPISAIEKGVVVPRGFDTLLTEDSKKYILNAMVNKEDAPVVSYCNKITLKHV